MSTRVGTVLAVVVVAATVVGSAPAARAAAPGEGTVRLSVSIWGGQGHGYSHSPQITSDGRYVAFTSNAPDLVRGDTNDHTDVFVRDTRKNTTQRVSLSGSGGQLDGASLNPSISGDGRYVAFVSFAANIAPGDRNDHGNVFVHDRVTAATVRLAPSSVNDQYDHAAADPQISTDGRYVAFFSSSRTLPGATDDTGHVYVWERSTGAIERISVGTDGIPHGEDSFDPVISADGRYVAFVSLASNLVPDDSPGSQDIFVRDRHTGSTTRISESSTGEPGNTNSVRVSISADGRYLAFDSTASNLVPDDTNGALDVFVHDRQTGTTDRVSLSSIGGQLPVNNTEGVISADGRHVAFTAGGTGGGDFGNIYLRDLSTGQLTKITATVHGQAANGYSGSPTVDEHGQHVAFISTATNLTPRPDRDYESVFLRYTTPSAT